MSTVNMFVQAWCDLYNYGTFWQQFYPFSNQSFPKPEERENERQNERVDRRKREGQNEREREKRERRKRQKGRDRENLEEETKWREREREREREILIIKITQRTVSLFSLPLFSSSQTTKQLAWRTLCRC
mgnify:CR=1 FL=1